MKLQICNNILHLIIVTENHKKSHSLGIDSGGGLNVWQLACLHLRIVSPEFFSQQLAQLLVGPQCGRFRTQKNQCKGSRELGHTQKIKQTISLVLHDRVSARENVVEIVEVPPGYLVKR